MFNGHKVGAIKRAIELHIHPRNNRSDFYINYKNWYVGITNNADLRKVQHQKGKNIPALYFKSWNADTKASAIEIEKYFHGIGMKDKSSIGGARESTTYVYIFKIKSNPADDLAHLFGFVK